jgi:hypothetical protein
MMAGSPSSMNIHLHPNELIKYPERIDIHNIVTGFPRIKKVLARDLSFFVNHLLSKTIIAGITALSTTPSMKRITIKKFTFFVKPVAIAQKPHKIKDQNINFFVLRTAA